MELCEAKMMVEGEVRQWLGDGWVVKYFRAARLYGQCRHMRKVNIIRFNEHFLEQCGPDEVRALARHEIAHGLAGRGHGHDAHFASICRQIGAPARSATRISIDVPFKFRLTCTGCGRVYQKHAYKRTWRCGACRGRLSVERA